MSETPLTLKGEVRKSTAGRKAGSKNKLKIPTDGDIRDSFFSACPEAFQTLLNVMQTGSEANKLKAAVKILDTSVTISFENEKLTITKQKLGQHSTTTVTADTLPSKTPFGGLLSTDYVSTEG